MQQDKSSLMASVGIEKPPATEAAAPEPPAAKPESVEKIEAKKPPVVEEKR